MNRHPITGLSEDGLRGWVAHAAWIRRVIEREKNWFQARQTILDRINDMASVAAGFLPEEEEEEAERRQEGLEEAVSAAVADAYTPQRLALLRILWPTCMAPDEILAKLNALPGEEIPSLSKLRSRASSLGLLRSKDPIPPEYLAKPGGRWILTEDRGEALMRLRDGTLKDIDDVCAEYGCTMDEARQIFDAFQAEKGRAA